MAASAALAALALCCATSSFAEGPRPAAKPAGAAQASNTVNDERDPGTPATPPQRISYAALVMAQAPVMPPAAAQGGGSGKVWVDTATHVYYCPGAHWYGKTREGQYMSVSDAKAAHAHAHRGKRCS